MILIEGVALWLAHSSHKIDMTESGHKYMNSAGLSVMNRAGKIILKHFPPFRFVSVKLNMK